MSNKRKASKLITSFFSKKIKTESVQETQCSDEERDPEIIQDLNLNVAVEKNRNSTNLIFSNFHPETFDLAKFEKSDVIFEDDNLKAKILQHDLIPESSFIYPSNSGRRFSLKDAKRFGWLAYSKSTNSVLCKVCFLFATNATCGKGDHQSRSGFVEKPYFNNWQKSKAKMQRHSETGYHKFCIAASQNFMNIRLNKTDDILSLLDSTVQLEKKENREALKPIIKTILFAAENEIPLRGDEDSEFLM